MLKKAEYRIVVGSIMILYCMVVTALDGFDTYNINEAIIMTLIATGSTLLGIGIIKNHKSFNDNV